MTFRLGINYWPVTSAMYWWRHFDAAEVARDFARIRAAGFGTVRIFLCWEDFQPAPDRVAPARLPGLRGRHCCGQRVVADAHPTGHEWRQLDTAMGASLAGEEVARFRVVSGEKVVRAKLKNWYSDASILKAQTLLAREVAATLCKHPALWAYDLGNENSNCVVPPSRAAALDWLDTVASAIRSVDTSHPITLGLHMEDLEEDRHLGPGEAARVCDFLCMHGYPIYALWATSATDALLLPFLGLITRWLGGKDVLFAEFGVDRHLDQNPQCRGRSVCLTKKRQRCSHAEPLTCCTGSGFWAHSSGATVIMPESCGTPRPWMRLHTSAPSASGAMTIRPSLLLLKSGVLQAMNDARGMMLGVDRY
jgi:endo-1,4-beta-mannosidase